MQVDIAIAGGGFAGTAAAWAARRALGPKAAIVQIFRHDGASGLYSGVFDAPADDSSRGHVEAAAEFLDQLHCRSNASEGSSPHPVATRAGVIRAALASDRALLDLSRFERCMIGVPDFERLGWDAAWLARALSETQWAKQRGVLFEAIRVGLSQAFWQQGTDFDLASALEQREGQDQLLSALKREPQPRAWLLGPWLGARAQQASALGERLGVPLGEVTSAPGDAAGARFVAARDRLLDQLAVRRLRGTVAALRSSPGQALQLDVDRGAGDPLQIVASWVVVAIGGFAGGGLQLDPKNLAVQLSMRAPMGASLGGNDVTEAGSRWGPDFVQWGAQALIHAGVPVRERRDPRILLAGDVRADSLGGWGAVTDGLAIGNRLCRQPAESSGS